MLITTGFNPWTDEQKDKSAPALRRTAKPNQHGAQVRALEFTNDEILPIAFRAAVVLQFGIQPERCQLFD